MTTERTGSASCIVEDSKVIVAGGWDGLGHLNTCEYLDLEAKGGDRKKWIMIPSTMRETRSWFSGVILNDGVIFLVTGGYTNGARLASCEQLDTTTMTWSDAPAMANTRSNHCTVLYKKKAVVLGGKVSDHRSALCEQYSSSSKAWSRFPPLSHPRSGHGACILNDQIYVCGGYVSGALSSSVEVFDGIIWSVLGSPLSKLRWNHVCVVWEGKIVVLGGSEVDAEVFDEKEKKWRVDVIPRTNERRADLTAHVLKSASSLTRER